MTRRLLNLFAAQSLLIVLSSGPCSCARTASPLAQADARAEVASPPVTAPATPKTTGKPAWVEALVDAIRNDQLVWEIEWPTPDTYKDLVAGPHFSPRGRPDSPVQALAPWQPWSASTPEPGRPPLRLELLAAPLLSALDDPDRWMAAHVVLTHLLLRVRLGPEEDIRWRLLRDYNLKEYIGWPAEDFAAKVDGTYVYYFNGVRADLTPQGRARRFDYGGSYGGKFTVRAASARIDPKQMAETRHWWATALKPVLDRAAATAAPAGNQSDPKDE